ncbi:MAG: gvpK [Rhodospirillaceae bacterium]|nr:MAG: gvpK [Rhodospirillaceae bacterium]
MSETAIEGLLGGRVDVDPETVERGLVKLVLSLIETLRQVVERLAIRRVEGGTLTEEDIERLGLTLLRLERRMGELRRIFGLERRRI